MSMTANDVFNADKDYKCSECGNTSFTWKDYTAKTVAVCDQCGFEIDTLKPAEWKTLCFFSWSLCRCLGSFIATSQPCFAQGHWASRRKPKKRKH